MQTLGECIQGVHWDDVGGVAKDKEASLGS